MRCLFCCLFAIACLLVARAGDFAFVYRGRVDMTGKAGAADLPIRVSAYAEAAGGASVWTQSATAKIDAQGVFQLEFVDDTLAAAFREGKAKWLGVAFLGEAEQYPRQRILEAPIVERAERAERLAPNARVGTLDAESVTANAASLAAEVEINGTLVNSGDDTLSVSSVAAPRSRIRFAKASGTTVELFKQAAPQGLSRTGLTAGETLFSGTRGGVVTIITESNWTAPCVTFFAPAGDIKAPFSASGTVRVYYYPFGTAN